MKRFKKNKKNYYVATLLRIGRADLSPGCRRDVTVNKSNAPLATWREGGASGAQEAGPCLCGCRKRRWLPFWRNSSRAQPGQATTTTKTKKDKTSGKCCCSFKRLHVSRGPSWKITAVVVLALSLPVAQNDSPARLAVTLASGN